MRAISISFPSPSKNMQRSTSMKKLAVSPTAMACTPCDCDTQLSSPCSKWMTLSEPLISAICTRPSICAAALPLAIGLMWCGRMPTV